MCGAGRRFPPRLRHGLDDGEPKSWKAVAGIIGLDLQRVRTVERSAMMKLRKPQMLQVIHLPRPPHHTHSLTPSKRRDKRTVLIY